MSIDIHTSHFHHILQYMINMGRVITISQFWGYKIIIFFSGYEMYDRVYLQILRHSYKWAYICIMLKIGHDYIEFLPGHLPRTTWNRFLCSVFLFPQALKMTPQRSSHVKDEGCTVRPKNDLFVKMYNFRNQEKYIRIISFKNRYRYLGSSIYFPPPEHN